MKEFPPFNLNHLVQTVFAPKVGEKIAILIDLDDPKQVIDFKFLQQPGHPGQKKAYEVFYKELNECPFFAYETTGGSNLDLPKTAYSSKGELVDLENDVYSKYDIFLCVSTYSATAPLTAAAKHYNFRGATLHGLNDIILSSGLAEDYDGVSERTEKLRLGLTHADFVEIDFAVDDQTFHLKVELGKQEAQKSHGLCREAPDIVNLPAGEVYFVPHNASGTFPVKLEDETLVLLHVENCKATHATLIRGSAKSTEELNHLLKTDPAAGMLGELGFGTRDLPYSGSDIQDEKIFGTFHLATGRNDHLTGDITVDKFHNPKNAKHEDILFSSTKTPEIQVKQVRIFRHGKTEILIENYEPASYLLNLINLVYEPL